MQLQPDNSQPPPQARVKAVRWARRTSLRSPRRSLWTRPQSPPPPSALASCCTWGTACSAPARLSSKQWGSSAARRRWAGPRACVGPDAGGPRSPGVQPPSTQLRLKTPAGKNAHASGHPGYRENNQPTNLFESSKIEVSIGEILPNGDIERDLGIVVVVAQVQIFIHVILDHKGLVAIQTASATVWVKHRGHGLQVMFTERRDEALVKAQLVQEDLEPKRWMEERADQSLVGLLFEGCVLEDCLLLKNSGWDN